MVNPNPPASSEIKDEPLYESELSESDKVYSDETYSSYPSRFLSQAVISGIVLIMFFGISQMHHKWAELARLYLHRAVNATTMETFGVVAKATFFKSIVKNVTNLVRLEEITKHISETRTSGTEQEIFHNWSWPVKGNITKRFGWETEISGNLKRFYPGIEITAPSNYTVNAVASGRIIEIRQEENSGWQIIMDHGRGWKSVYHNLDGVRVEVGQYVVTGEILAGLAEQDQNVDSKMSFELKKDDQPVDPLTVLVNN
jgi:murein DD-endopeptidase MepM/ murein hydrolase activator NlpD